MAEFDKQIKTALKLIKKKGKVVKWRVLRDGAPPDGNKPWKVAAADTLDYDVSICFVPIGSSSALPMSFIVNAPVPVECLSGFMAAADAVSFTPSLKDIVIMDDKELRIENIGTLSPNGQNIIHAIVFKK